MDKTQKRIIDAYTHYVVENKNQPSSIESFASELKLKESTFLKHFSSFNQLQQDFWSILFDDTIQKIESEEIYQTYSVNEKVLAFYFTWIEALKEYRSYAIYVLGQERIYELYPSDFDTFKKRFNVYISNLVEEGVATQEIAKRLYITDKYHYVLWSQPVSIIKFWVKDESKNFEDTDALIEKTVNFSFDLMNPNGFDSFFDLAKFHIQHF